MVNFKIFLLCLIPVNVQSNLRRTRPETRHTRPPEIPDYTDKDFKNRVMIPNEEFCKNMALRSSDFYMVMPWWYHYCEGLTERARKGVKEKDIERLQLLKPFQNVLDKIATSLQIKSIASKKYDTSSDESIENILFYKDFRPKKELAPLPVEPLVLPTPPKQQPECIPRMCCSMSCTNTCGQNEMSVDKQNQHMQSMNPMNPMNSMNSMKSMNSMNSMMSLPLRQSSRLIPPFSQHKNKLPTLPFQSRKSFGTAREHIKSLISKDEDIKKILRDLVRVTMKKVDLLEMIKARRATEVENAGLNDDDGKEL